jgi:uncharacterized protein (DUF488 family)
MKNTIADIGHSNRAYSEFLKILQDSKIEVLVDIRSFPRSRFCPWFNEKRLSNALKDENITYLFKGKNLGGLKENIDYEETIDELVEMVKAGKQVCVMCSEKDYLKCHRYTMLQPSFEQRGLEVKHIGV